eukprot:PhM_4_TR14582/c0_g1_i1/m.41570
MSGPLALWQLVVRESMAREGVLRQESEVRASVAVSAMNNMCRLCCGNNNNNNNGWGPKSRSHTVMNDGIGHGCEEDAVQPAHVVAHRIAQHVSECARRSVAERRRGPTRFVQTNASPPESRKREAASPERPSASGLHVGLRHATHDAQELRSRGRSLGEEVERVRKALAQL